MAIYSYPFTSMMEYDPETGVPSFDRAISADVLRKLFMKDRSNGVIMLTDSSSLLVQADDPESMTVLVNPGFCFINGATMCSDEIERITLDTADLRYDRIDSIVLRLDDTSTEEGRKISIEVLKGEPDESPQIPELTRNADYFELGIANIRVKKQSSMVEAQYINDTRMLSWRCGESLPLQEFDTTGLYNQIQDQIDKNLELIQSALDETTAGYLQNQIDALSGEVDEKINDVEVNGVSVVDYDKIAKINTGQFMTAINLELVAVDGEGNETPIEEAQVDIWNKLDYSHFTTYRYTGEKARIVVPRGTEYVITVEHLEGLSTPLCANIAANTSEINLKMDYDATQTRTFEMYINNSESNPANKVTYPVGSYNQNATPGKMNYSTGRFDYGNWFEAFFMPRPCMVRYDGTVDYYLDPNDYTKKADGMTPSDITNMSYSGNAMMEWGRPGKKIYYKITPSTDKLSATISIADNNIDGSYKAWSFLDANGNPMDHFYTSIYEGSLYSNKLRSMSGQVIMVEKTAQQELDYAHANNTGSKTEWSTWNYGDITLINFLLLLVGRSTNMQATFGNGNSNNTGKINTGAGNTKGLFWGSNNETSVVKVFGMENWWGNVWMRYEGHCTDSARNNLVKLTRSNADGSIATDYNLTGNGYIQTETGVRTQNVEGYRSSSKFGEIGFMIPYQLSGSATTHYCDYGAFADSKYALLGGDWGSTSICGAFYVRLYGAASYAYSSVGAALSFKPLAAS